MTTPKLKHFCISAQNPDADHMIFEPRLVKAQTVAQVVALLKREALATVERFKVEPATGDELIELTAAGIKVEQIQE